MLLQTDHKYQIRSGNLQFSFLNTGDLFEASHQSTMINQVQGNPIDGSLNNLYLRLFQNDEIKVIPLIGIHSNSKMAVAEFALKWSGVFENVHYEVSFILTDSGVWFWDVKLEGSGIEYDLIYGQDLGLADKGAVRSNEAYISQYTDHTVYEDAKRGFVVCSRQNQSMQSGFPYLQQGSLNEVKGFSTDGFQFFGTSYRETNEPEALSKESLANEIYQYEFAYIALQSERKSLKGKDRVVFYGLFKEDHPEAVTSLAFEDEILAAWKQVEGTEEIEFHPVEKISLSSEFGKPLQTVDMNEEEIHSLFPVRKHEEHQDGALLSFFTDTHEHVVLKGKERLVERPHGHILMSGHNDRLTENVMTTTSYMTGVFNSQLVVGNTSFNKMLTNTRNALNVMKTSGQRLYIEIDGTYHLLGIPSLFEIGFNYTRWFYKTEDDLIVVTNHTTVDTPEVRLNVRSEKGKAYRFLLSNQVTMNNNEFEVPFNVEQQGETIVYSAADNADSAQVFPELCYRMKVDGAEIKLTDEQIFSRGLEPKSTSLSVLDLSPSSDWTVTIQGLLHGEEMDFIQKDVAEEIEKYRRYYADVMNGFKLSTTASSSKQIDKLNTLSWWYTHNMLVHYSVPHGLEQYGGAAWGTRDVCQGPTEYFLATQNYESVREIIQTLYAHQYGDDGSWPQWFMFDQYFKIQAHESHGDVIVWPLKVVSDYVRATGDFGILKEEIPYTLRDGFNFSNEKETLIEHIKKQIDYIKSHFLHDTFLSSYDDGDWDDTLQPANQQLKKYMASSWTVALTYQVIHQLSKVLERVDHQEAIELKTLAFGIKEDYNRFMFKTDVLPGFLYMENRYQPELMIHPTDTKTGIDYRLIPMNRSIISELFTPEQAKSHYELIKEHLYCPDGVRLMNRPANYAGGVSTHFKRAEQAANFGREIGLQYVHAHIRFVEAMAKLGHGDEVWKGLEIINPIGLKDVVPNAELRQSNTYFSSSDGKFNTRYEAQERFDELRKGTVPVKGGWRIYSSGPGIYMNQLISNALGIRIEDGRLIIDPVLSDELNGLRFEFRVLDRPVAFIYSLDNEEKSVKVNGANVETETLLNRYREGGFAIKLEELEKHLNEDDNLIEISI
ncbi:amylo-alpha-1,6-glucosidase [Alkalihalobacillus sp. TS-13]|uniref:GH36-type glycosyl hydrolase domain-containing protein n=1 Tax=Alkalihalobacillus sp. TS-13 TaxID=2842455 RepID=UPI0028936DA6|nr:amylo-alpha-1,6-glucosidase [Alkalihalobacillus sp. TS-13]